MRLKALTMLWGALAALVTLAPVAYAENGPKDWEIGLQPAVSPIADQIHGFHHMLLIIITCITAFVMLLLLYVMIRFNSRSNPVPSKTSHNTLVEVLWTVIPVMILVTIAIPSFKLIYAADRTENPELTIKAIGHQWYWSYEYPDNGNFTFDSLMTADKDLKPGQPRLLEADNHLVIPVNTKIRILVTAADVIHSFTVPAFGFKLDGEPGRVNETWTEVTQEGTYYGQCSELCGANHAYMPIAVDVVSKEKYLEWVAEAQKKFAQADAPAIDVAAAAPAPAAN